MNDYITQVEGRLFRQKVKEQEVEIANLKNHVKALQRIIERGGGECGDLQKRVYDILDRPKGSG